MNARDIPPEITKVLNEKSDEPFTVIITLGPTPFQVVAKRLRTSRIRKKVAVIRTNYPHVDPDAVIQKVSAETGISPVRYRYDTTTRTMTVNAKPQFILRLLLKPSVSGAMLNQAHIRP